MGIYHPNICFFRETQDLNHRRFALITAMKRSKIIFSCYRVLQECCLLEPRYFCLTNIITQVSENLAIERTKKNDKRVMLDAVDLCSSSAEKKVQMLLIKSVL